jgi:hypothetical protein
MVVAADSSKLVIKKLEYGEVLEKCIVHNRYHTEHFMCHIELVIQIC